jgi:hypothetical protein
VGGTGGFVDTFVDVTGGVSSDVHPVQPLFLTNWSRSGVARLIETVVSVRPSVCHNAMG